MFTHACVDIDPQIPELMTSSDNNLRELMHAQSLFASCSSGDRFARLDGLISRSLFYWEMLLLYILGAANQECDPILCILLLLLLLLLRTLSISGPHRPSSLPSSVPYTVQHQEEQVPWNVIKPLPPLALTNCQRFH